MPESIKIFLFLLVIFFANVMQTITGFAGTVLAMPFSILIMGSDFSRVVLNILGILASLGVVILNRKAINWKEVLKMCLIMLVGMVGGYLILGLVDISKQVLLFILAGFVLLFTGIGCFNTFVKKEGLQEQAMPEKQKITMPGFMATTITVTPITEEPKEEEREVVVHDVESPVIFKDPWYKEVLLYGLLLVAGIVHGMYVCGGPLLIIYATKKLKNKDKCYTYSFFFDIIYMFRR